MHLHRFLKSTSAKKCECVYHDCWKRSMCLKQRWCKCNGPTAEPGLAGNVRIPNSAWGWTPGQASSSQRNPWNVLDNAQYSHSQPTQFPKRIHPFLSIDIDAPLLQKNYLVQFCLCCMQIHYRLGGWLWETVHVAWILAKLHHLYRSGCCCIFGGYPEIAGLSLRTLGTIPQNHPLPQLNLCQTYTAAADRLWFGR